MINKERANMTPREARQILWSIIIKYSSLSGVDIAEME